MVFHNRQKEIEEGVNRYCEEVTVAVKEFQHALEEYISRPNLDTLRENLRQVHCAESKADDLRAEIEVLMYTKSVFPESREDILELLEMLDKIPNHAESCIRMVLTQHIIIPQEYTSEILTLVKISQHAVRHILDAAKMLFQDRKSVV